MEGYIAEIRHFGGNFAPMTWAFCQGQILSIAQNTALFALLGTTFGGNGQTTFALPDKRGRVFVGTGTGPGLPNVQLGDVAGTPSVTLLSTELPMHTHTATGGMNAVQTKATTAQASAGSLLGRSIDTSGTGVTPAIYVPAGTAGTQVALGGLSVTNGIAGGSQPHNNMQPYLGMNAVICLQGIFPSRN